MQSKEVVSYCIDWSQQSVCECFIFLVFSNIVQTQFYLIDFTTRPHFHLQIRYAVSSFFVYMWVGGCVCVHVQGPGRAHTLVPWHRFYHHVGPDMSSHFLSVIAKRASGLAPHDPECNKPCSTRTEKQPHTLARCHPGQMSPV